LTARTSAGTFRDRARQISLLIGAAVGKRTADVKSAAAEFAPAEIRPIDHSYPYVFQVLANPCLLQRIGNKRATNLLI